MDQIEKYINNHDVQKIYVQDLLDEFSNEIAEMHGECIDIGCGPGSTTAKLILPYLPVDANITGVDILKNAISIARKMYTEKKRVSFMELNIATDNLAPHLIGGFDNAISTFCINWCPQPSQAFKNIYNLLRPGGKALVLLVAKDTRVNIFPKLYDNPEYQPYMQDYSIVLPCFHNVINPRQKLRTIIEECGFQILHCSQRWLIHEFDNHKDYAEHFIALNPFLGRMPETLQKKYEKDISQELLNIEYIAIRNKMKGSIALQQAAMLKCEILVAFFKKPEIHVD